MSFSRLARIAAAAGVMLPGLPLLPAWADAIDGEWCREGRHFAIDGPNILTYGGTRMTGDYHRHGFRYVVPPGEPEAGTEIEIDLQGEELTQLRRKAPGAAAFSASEPWRRCRVTS